MDGMILSRLPNASFTVPVNDTNTASDVEKGKVSPNTPPIDTVEFSNVVEATDAFEQVRFGMHKASADGGYVPSLSTLLDQVKQVLQDAVHEAKESFPSFFERMDAIFEKLEGTENLQEFRAVSELVAATRPEQAEAYVKATEQAAEHFVAKQEKGKVKEPKINLADLRVAVNTKGDLDAKLEAVNIQLQDSSDKVQAEVKISKDDVKVEVND